MAFFHNDIQHGAQVYEAKETPPDPSNVDSLKLHFY